MAHPQFEVIVAWVVMVLVMVVAVVVVVPDTTVDVVLVVVVVVGSHVPRLFTLHMWFGGCKVRTKYSTIYETTVSS